MSEQSSYNQEETIAIPEPVRHLGENIEARFRDQAPELITQEEGIRLANFLIEQHGTRFLDAFTKEAAFALDTATGRLKRFKLLEMACGCDKQRFFATVAAVFWQDVGFKTPQEAQTFAAELSQQDNPFVTMGAPWKALKDQPTKKNLVFRSVAALDSLYGLVNLAFIAANHNDLFEPARAFYEDELAQRLRRGFLQETEIARQLQAVGFNLGEVRPLSPGTFTQLYERLIIQEPSATPLPAS